MPAHKITLSVRTMSVLANTPEPLKAHQIARKLGTNCNAVRVILCRLMDKRSITRIEQDGGVFYTVPHEATPTIWQISALWGLRRD